MTPRTFDPNDDPYVNISRVGSVVDGRGTQEVPIVTVEPPVSVVPERDTEDWATLAAWYGSFGYADHWRKVCLANCREIIRAKAAIEGVKHTVDRVDDLARLHPNYIAFLTTHLQGRMLWEDEYKRAGGLP